MDTENNTSVTDEQRRLAEAKRVSIQPLNPSVQPEALPSDSQATLVAGRPAASHAPNDVEQDAPTIQPTPSLVSSTAAKKAPPARFVRAGTMGALIFLILAILAVVFYILD